MAYAERVPGRNKTLVVITVAGLHGMALYGLITGLGVEYYDRVATVLTGTNIPVEPTPPPPQPVPSETAVTPRTVQTSRPSHIDVLPGPLAPTDTNWIDMPIKPVPPTTIDPPGPTASATPDKPLFTPRAVRPRGNPALWVSTDDYPGASLRRGEQGSVRFELAVGTDGRVTGCQVTASSGSADLDAATCRFVSKRARFDPATDGTGARVAGSYKGSIRWVIPRD